MLTDDEFRKLEKLMRVVVQEATKPLEEKIEHIPTDEIFEKMDTAIRVIVKEEVGSRTENLEEKMHMVLDKVTEMKDQIIGEVRKNREEQTLITGSLSEHSDRIDVCEERLDVLEDKPAKKKLH